MMLTYVVDRLLARHASSEVLLWFFLFSVSVPCSLGGNVVVTPVSLINFMMECSSVPITSSFKV